jgi:glycosyltransferase involved in cell wall biosynthesis
VKKPEQIEDHWKIVLVVAQVAKFKRHDLVLSAFERVASIHRDVHLVCVGPVDPSNPSWWSYLQERTMQSQFVNRIHWIGEVDDPRGWYRNAFALVLASEKEAFGRVLVEAMACGVPVIATNAGGMPEVLREGRDGILVPPGSAQGLADAITQLLDNPFLRTRLTKASLERASAFDLPRLVKRMSQLFEDSISQKRPIERRI